MSYSLFLDDVREPGDVTWVALPRPAAGWVIARDFVEFARIVDKRGIPEFVTFDHDLGPEHYEAYMELRSGKGTYADYYRKGSNTGHDCLKWFITEKLLEGKSPMPPYELHTLNVIGKRVMQDYIDQYERFLDANS